MPSQNDQNQTEIKTTALNVAQGTKLAFIGCDKCSLNCCDGTRFRRFDVFLNGINDMSRLFPVVFLQSKDRKKTSMALIFSLKKGVPCIYQETGSKKCTIYDGVRPHACRSYPFQRTISRIEGGEKHFTIGFDKYCKGVQESAEGIQIFTDDGAISEEVLNNFFCDEILANYEKNLSATNRFIELLEEFGLLVKARIVIGKESLPGGGFQNVYFRFLAVNEKKLTTLNQDSIKRLQAGGYINVINLHLKSLAIFHKLLEAVSALEEPGQPNKQSDIAPGG